MNRISAVILTRDSQRLIDQVLRALEDLDEVIILDNGSTDATLSIAKGFNNVKIHTHPFIGFGPLKALGAKLAKNDWIFSIDSDEIASSELIVEILHLPLEEQIIYSYEVKNYFNNRWIKSCGWSPDRALGLYNKKFANFNDAQVHEGITPYDHSKIVEVQLKGYIRHFPFTECSVFITKMQKYSTLYATQFMGKKKSTPTKAVIHSLWSFFRSYILQRGFTEGFEGLTISAYNAQSVFWKYIKLYEANLKLQNKQEV